MEQLVSSRLEYLKNNHGEKSSSYKNAQSILTDFAHHPRYGFAKTTIRDMRDGGIARIKLWVAAHRWNDSTKHLVYSTLKAMFNYATDKHEDSLNIIETSPIARLNTGRMRVKARARLWTFSAEQEAAILANADPRGLYVHFGLAFKTLLATGVRPEEFCSLTAADVVKDDNGRLHWWIDHKNQYRTGEKRRVYLTPEVERVTAEQMKLYPEGPIFRNCWGKPWDVDSLYRALRRVTARPACKALGLDDYDLGTRTDGKRKKEYRFVTYSCRHTFAHRHLTGFYKKPDGTPIVLNYGEVGALMGNSAAEVERTYGKLAKATTHLSSLLQHG
jgi:integrase